MQMTVTPLTDEEFLAARANHIGSSDAAGVLNCSKWDTPFTVWLRKGANWTPDSEKKDNDPMKWGRKLEQFVADCYADAVGPSRVMAGTDCGLGGRISSDVAWAKLATLVEGARLASDGLGTR